MYGLYTCMVYGAVWLYGRYSGDLGGDVHVSLVSVRARVLGGNNCARMGTYEETVRAQIASVRARLLSLYPCAHVWPRARTGSPRARTGRMRIREATHTYVIGNKASSTSIKRVFYHPRPDRAGAKIG